MKKILDEYEKWAKTHNPTWETDNLIGDIIGWPKDYKGLADRSSSDFVVGGEVPTPAQRLTHILEWLYTMDGEYDDRNEWREGLVSHLFWLADLPQGSCGADK